MRTELEWHLEHETLPAAQRAMVAAQLARAAYFFASDIRLQHIQEPANGEVYGPAQRDHNLCAAMATARELIGTPAQCQIGVRQRDDVDVLTLRFETAPGTVSYQWMEEAVDVVRDGIEASCGPTQAAANDSFAALASYGR